MSQKDNLLNDKRQKALKLIEEWITAEETGETGSKDETLLQSIISNANHHELQIEWIDENEFKNKT